MSSTYVTVIKVWHAPLTDVLGAEISEDRTSTPELREILNYVAAAEYAYEWVGERRRITRGLICELHGILMRDLNIDASTAGQIRDIQVEIGAGGRIRDARFVPPPPGHELETGMTDLLKWINRPGRQAARTACSSVTRWSASSSADADPALFELDDESG